MFKAEDENVRAEGATLGANAAAAVAEINTMIDGSFIVELVIGRVALLLLQVIEQQHGGEELAAADEA